MPSEVETGDGSPEWSERVALELEWVLESPNTRFELPELKGVDGVLRELAEDLKHVAETQKLTAQQLGGLRATVEDMREASRRIGRKDWVLLGMGAVTAWAIRAAFPPAVVVHAGKLFVHEVAHLFVE